MHVTKAKNIIDIQNIKSYNFFSDLNDNDFQY